MKEFARSLFALLMTSGLCVAADDEQDRGFASASQLTEILVTGEQPGPGLWKISKGEHSLSILGVYGPLPKQMTWRSTAVREIVAHSQELVGWGGVVVEVDSSAGLFERFKAGAALSRFKKNPNDAKLSDVVAPGAYAKWGVLKAKYLGRDNSIEKLRPLFAAEALQKAAIKRMGLDDEKLRAVMSVIVAVQKKYNIKALTPKRTIHLHGKDLVESVKNLPALRLDDGECFSRTVNGLESRLLLQRERANAWAIGDIEALTKLNQLPPSQDCTELFVAALFGVEDLADQERVRRVMERLENEFDVAQEQLRTDWVGLAEDALDKNIATFGMLPIYELVGPDGALALLGKKGYSIQNPTDGAALETRHNAAQ